MVEDCERLALYTNCAKIHEGVEAFIHACMRDDVEWIVKIFKDFDSYLNENAEATMSNSLGIGPRMVDSWQCQENGYVVYEKWDGSLQTLMNNAVFEKTVRIPYREEIAAQIEPQITSLERVHKFHNDIHPGNILFKLLPNGDYRFTLADFGQMSSHPKEKATYRKDPTRIDRAMFAKVLKEFPAMPASRKRLLASQ